MCEIGSLKCIRNNLVPTAGAIDLCTSQAQNYFFEVLRKTKGSQEALPGSGNRPFPSCCKPHYENEAKCKSFSYEN